MNCDRCGEREGRIQYTEVREGVVEKQLICGDCARELGFGDDADPLPEGVETGLEEAAAEAAVDALRCPGCGITGAELRNQHLLGCPECWDTFAERLDGVLHKLHGTALHRGRIPGGAVVDPPDPEDLKRKIEEAIEAEDFETAARLRDRLRRADGGKG